MDRSETQERDLSAVAASEIFNNIASAPVHISHNGEARSYAVIHLPSCSPEQLNKVEDFWSVLKNSVKQIVGDTIILSLNLFGHGDLLLVPIFFFIFYKPMLICSLNDMSYFSVILKDSAHFEMA
ncbi:uncharacterized protein EV154DRAFT_479093 [Mucor mucedo]|uniref:uncharacterized protein n=1 Tax=Mucor mucedo TaxID=29922 RepID=UPI00221E5D30|nr:uncharacterized protein EV154DRAFT_479093 [Mucor mucedo]KAI7893792.1 hypothetical protein EV154DRAFT_479093 [Mucor mucedo]